MQMDPSTRLDLSGTVPSPDANVARFSKAAANRPEGLNLIHETPGPASVVQTDSYEVTSVAISSPLLRMWLRVEGPRSWAPALCCFFVVLAIGTAFLVTAFLVPITAPPWVRFVVFGASGGSILFTGLGWVAYLLRRLQ
jgi:hypothetical protein